MKTIALNIIGTVLIVTPLLMLALSYFDVLTKQFSLQGIKCPIECTIALFSQKVSMKITISHVGQFREAFHHAGRGSQFTYEALGLLFEYLEENNSDYELDVIELCCEYSEDDIQAIAASYDIDLSLIHI